MKPVVHHPEEAGEYFFIEGCYILESWNSKEDPAVSLARARVAPGVTTKAHRLHGVAERYLIIAGRGLVTLGKGPPQPVGPGDVVIIPAGVYQQITNIGTGDLIFYAICTPRFTVECYESLEKNV